MFRIYLSMFSKYTDIEACLRPLPTTIPYNTLMWFVLDPASLLYLSEPLPDSWSHMNQTPSAIARVTEALPSWVFFSEVK